MGGETLSESWIGSLWRASRKSVSLLETSKPVVGILAFEITALMSKVVNMWQLLSDKQNRRLREEILNSVGIQKLVSDDDDYLMDLAFAEIIGNLGYVAKSVARLGKRCADPVYHNLECVVDDPVKVSLTWFGWDYRLKKMERKVKKMERFIGATTQLHQELEVLAELEQSLRRMQANVDLKKVKLLEFQQKVIWQRHEVKHLREISPWMRSYDFIVRLLLRSLLTIIKKIHHLYGMKHTGDPERRQYAKHVNGEVFVRSYSTSAHLQPAIYPSENNPSSFISRPLGRSISNLGLTGSKGWSTIKKLHSRHNSVISGKHSQSNYNRFAHVGPFKACMMAASDCPVEQSCPSPSTSSVSSALAFQKETWKMQLADSMTSSCFQKVCNEASTLKSMSKLLNASASTLGGAALALHYANIIILIEKLASYPHLISLDARDDLYNMLPASIKASLRKKLKIFRTNYTSSVYDDALAAEWSLALSRILAWLAPLAHNMIRWHSERNFEKQDMPSGTNVLLIQTLYFADHSKTEAAILEVLMGLNYLSKFGELHEKSFLEFRCNRPYNDHLLDRDSITCSAIDHPFNGE